MPASTPSTWQRPSVPEYATSRPFSITPALSTGAPRLELTVPPIRAVGSWPGDNRIHPRLFSPRSSSASVTRKLRVR